MDHDKPSECASEIHQARRRINGVYVFLLIALGLIIFNYRGPVTSVDCTPEVIASKPDVIMLGAWWCTYCYQAKRYFQNNNISYCEYDMENDPVGIRLYQDHGGGVVPVFIIGDKLIRGYDPQLINTAIDHKT
jgi:glutaredoxin